MARLLFLKKEMKVFILMWAMCIYVKEEESLVSKNLV